MTDERLGKMAERVLRQKRTDDHGPGLQNPGGLYVTGFKDGFMEGIRYIKDQIINAAKKVETMS